MKKKIGTLYGKPIVEGDTNLVTNNEVHINNLNNKEINNNNNNSSEFKYYSLKTDKSNEDFLFIFQFIKLIPIFQAINKDGIFNNIIVTDYDSTGSIEGYINYGIFSSIDGSSVIDIESLKAICICTKPQYINIKDKNSTQKYKVEGDLANQIYIVISTLYKDNIPPELSLNSLYEMLNTANIKEITEEEYNKLIE